jgi:hypothetical protein
VATEVVVSRMGLGCVGKSTTVAGIRGEARVDSMEAGVARMGARTVDDGPHLVAVKGGGAGVGVVMMGLGPFVKASTWAAEVGEMTE